MQPKFAIQPIRTFKHFDNKKSTNKKRLMEFEISKNYDSSFKQMMVNNHDNNDDNMKYL